jgi:hypothetical protein
MAEGDQINIKPHFREEGQEEQKLILPCDGKAGDLFVFTTLVEGKEDDSPQGRAQLWFCTKGTEGDGRNAIWKRVQFDDTKTCAVPLVRPPQNTPQLREG